MPPRATGRLIAFLVLVATLVLALIGRLDLLEAVLIGGLALAVIV